MPRSFRRFGAAGFVLYLLSVPLQAQETEVYDGHSSVSPSATSSAVDILREMRVIQVDQFEPADLALLPGPVGPPCGPSIPQPANLRSRLSA